IIHAQLLHRISIKGGVVHNRRRARRHCCSGTPPQSEGAESEAARRRYTRHTARYATAALVSQLLWEEDYMLNERTQGELEAEVSKEVAKFHQEFMGRGP